ncbi:MAG: c-type cytochrome [Solirubrobacterales bacterium]
MDTQTVFIILGLALTALALVISFAGVKLEDFPPSKGILLACIGVFAALIGATAVFAWQGGEEEQDHRNELRASGEEPSPADVMTEMLEATEQARTEEEGETELAEGGGPETASAEGAALFDAQGCAGCHILEASGSTGTIGPDLDVELKGEDAAYVEEAIVDPEKEIVEGFPGGVMPDDFGTELSAEELEALVAYIADSVGSKS